MSGRRRWWHYALGVVAYHSSWPWLLGKAAVLVGGTAALWVCGRR